MTGDISDIHDNNHDLIVHTYQTKVSLAATKHTTTIMYCGNSTGSLLLPLLYLASLLPPPPPPPNTLLEEACSACTKHKTPWLTWQRSLISLNEVSTKVWCYIRTSSVVVVGIKYYYVDLLSLLTVVMLENNYLQGFIFSIVPWSLQVLIMGFYIFRIISIYVTHVHRLPHTYTQLWRLEQLTKITYSILV